jgi:hypothetical protein
MHGDGADFGFISYKVIVVYTGIHGNYACKLICNQQAYNLQLPWPHHMNWITRAYEGSAAVNSSQNFSLLSTDTN